MVFTKRNLAVMWCFSALKTCTEGCCGIPDASLYPRTARKCCFAMYLSQDAVLVFLWSSSFPRGEEFPCRPLLSPFPSEHLPLSCSFSHSCRSGRLIPAGTSGQVLAEWWAEMKGMVQLKEGMCGFCRVGERRAVPVSRIPVSAPDLTYLCSWHSTFTSHSRQCVVAIIFLDLVSCFNFIK